MQALLKDEALRWNRIAEELEETRKKFGSGPLGDRRTELGAAPPAVEVATEAFVEREADHRHPVRQGLDPRGEGRASPIRPSCTSRKATSCSCCCRARPPTG